VLHLLGGDLVIEWNKTTGRVLMTGPAEYVFEGEFFFVKFSPLPPASFPTY
jgi:diaminopimelate epimerase